MQRYKTEQLHNHLNYLHDTCYSLLKLTYFNVSNHFASLDTINSAKRFLVHDYEDIIYPIIRNPISAAFIEIISKNSDNL